ncbi:MAG: glycosyl hydrolase, partial [Thermoguttaceae bacterium]
MYQKWILSLFVAVISGLAFFGADSVALAQKSKLNPITEPNFEEFKTEFQKGPNRDFSTGPLWVWNDRLTEQQVRETLRDLASQNVKQVWVHPRPGLMTPYLSDEWFARWKESLDEAEKLDMNLWIYDENSYPSGFAGGFVPEALPDSRGKGLHFREVKSLDKLGDNTWYVYKLNADGTAENVTDQAKKDGKLPERPANEGNWLVGSISYAPIGPWFGDKFYVDLLKQGVTEKFIEITFDAYKREIGEHFGKRVPGIFTDEPHLQTAGGLTWNEEIPQLFEKKYGYSLIDAAPSLVREVGDWKKVRHDYQRLMLDLFVDRWAKKCFEWCEKNNQEFTGHYWEHGWPGAGHGPDNMAMYIWHQRPSIDILMNQYSEGVGGQFGNVRAVKELASVANQLGHARTLCELYGAGGWDLRYEDMKRQADWILALGVNTINEHLSYVTLRGARKRDHPQSFSYHSSWWDGYHTLANRNTRIQYALSQGRQINRVLILQPTTTGWMYQDTAKLGEIGNSFQNLINEFEKMNVEYDIGSEDIIERLGSVDNGKLVIGDCKYDMIILPPNTENLDSITLNYIADTAKGGGTVLYFELPKYVNGTTPDAAGAAAIKQLADSPSAKKVDLTQALIAGWNRTAGEGIRIEPDGLPNVFVQANGLLREDRAKNDPNYTPPAESGKVYHHRRRLGDKDIVFITNISIDEPATGWVCSNKDHAEVWDVDTGEISLYPTEEVGKPYIQFRYELPPCGSILLVLSGNTRVSNRDNKVAPEVPKEWYFPFEKYQTPMQPITNSTIHDNLLKESKFDATASANAKKVFKPLGETEIKRLDPNVLVLDYVDVQVGDEKLDNVYFYRANNWVFEKNGKEVGLTRNPWDNGVQFRDSLITKKFPESTGFTLTYKFNVVEKVPSPLYIVIERADLYAISCNGKQIAEAGKKYSDWWLDKAFYKVNITDAAKVGENEVVLTAKPMTIYHEIESAYLIGDFSVESTEKGFAVYPAKPLTLRTPEPENKEFGHSQELEGVSWLTKGIGFHQEDPKLGDRKPYIIFDLGENSGKTNPLEKIKVWNYNEVNLAKRGVKEMNLYYSATPKFDGANKQKIKSLTLTQGSSSGPQVVSDLPKPDEENGRFVIFEILSNYNGTAFPTDSNNPADDGLVGLAEVQFFNADGKQNRDVKIADVSSELTASPHNRRAKYLIDGSGLLDPSIQQG